MAKRRNPADATHRSTHARWKAEIQIKARIARLEKRVSELARRLRGRKERGQ